MTAQSIVRCALVLSICLCAALGQATATTWDASVDYSTTNGNPNGVWTYGYYENVIGVFTPYPAGGTMFGLPAWSADLADGMVPKGVVVCNSTDAPASTGWGNFEAHTLGYHPSPEGHRPTVRWTSPYNGPVSVTAVFKSGNGLATTDNHLLLNGVELWTGQVLGAVGVTCNEIVDVIEGDIMDLTGGIIDDWGSDATQFTFVIDSTMPGQVSGVVKSSMPGNPVVPGVIVTLKEGVATTTDGGGAYLFESVPPETYTLTFAKASYAPATHAVTVGSGENVVYDQTLETSMLTGTVTSSQGNAPLPHVRVSIVESDSEAVTDAVGHYEVMAAPGSCTVRFTKSGFQPAASAQLLTSGQTVTLDKQLTFVQEIWDAGYDFQATENPSGEWAYGYIDPNWTFIPYTNGHNPFPADPFRQWDVDPSGAVGGIVSKSWKSTEVVRYEGYYPPLPAGQPHLLGVRPSQDVNEIVSIRWTAPRDMTAIIHAEFSGLVPWGTSTACTVMQNYYPLFQTTVDGFTGTGGSGYTDGNGTNPKSGTWTITRVLANEAIDFTVNCGENWVNDVTGVIATVEPSQTGPGIVSGTVVGTGTSTDPVEGALVETADGRFRALTDFYGQYTITVPSGDVTLRASKHGYSTVTQTVNVPEDGSATGDFALETAELEGFVYNFDTGEPIVGARVANGTGDYVAYSLDLGDYVMNVPPGTATYTASKPGYTPESVTLAVTGTTSNVFRLHPSDHIDADLAADFLLGSNPNGNWVYGYYNGLTETVLTPYSTEQKFDAPTAGISGWGTDSAALGLVGKNFTAGRLYWYGYFEAGGVSIHPGPGDVTPGAEWIAPKSARVRITAQFADANPNWEQGATTTGTVRLNGTPIATGNIEHYAEPAILKWNYTGVINVVPGDRIGFGLNMFTDGHGSDMTQVAGHITESTSVLVGIGDLADLPIGSDVELTGKIAVCDGVTFTDGFYIEEPDRNAGIKVVGAANAASVLVGNTVSVKGLLMGSPGQLYIQADSLDIAAGTEVKPVGVVNRSVATTNGLLAKVWGNITAVDASEIPSFLYLDDGSSLIDGTGYPGVRVDIANLTSPDLAGAVLTSLRSQIGKTISVTGVVGIENIGGGKVLTIRPRSDTDINTD